jgi:hypothetical protein
MEERSLLFAYRQQQRDVQPQLPDRAASNVFSVGDRVVLQVRSFSHWFKCSHEAAPISPACMYKLFVRVVTAPPASRACQPPTPTAATLWSYLSFEMPVRDAKRWQAAATFVTRGAGRFEVRVTHPADVAARFAPSVAVRSENLTKVIGL